MLVSLSPRSDRTVTMVKMKVPRKNTIGQPIVAPNEYWQASIVLNCFYVSIILVQMKLGCDDVAVELTLVLVRPISLRTCEFRGRGISLHFKLVQFGSEHLSS